MISHIHILCFDQVHPFLFFQFPSIPPTTCPSQLHVLSSFFKTSWHHLVLGCISMGLEPSTSAWIASWGPNIWRKKTLPPSEAYNCTTFSVSWGGSFMMLSQVQDGVLSDLILWLQLLQFVDTAMLSCWVNDALLTFTTPSSMIPELWLRIWCKCLIYIWEYQTLILCTYICCMSLY